MRTLSSPYAEGGRSGWTASILLHYPEGLLSRLAVGLARWGVMSRGARRRIGRRVGVSTAVLALLLAMSGEPVGAASIAVAPGEVGAADNGLCSLVEALANADDTANGGLVYDDCGAGNPAGADAIILPPGSVFTLANSYSTVYYHHCGDPGLPPITSQITIEGNGSTLRSADGALPWHLIVVANSGDLTINQLDIVDDYNLTVYENGQYYYNYSSCSGIFSEGTLTITGSRLRDHVFGVYNNYGELHLSDVVIDGNGNAGVVNWGGETTATDCYLADNHGGAVNSDIGGIVTLERCTITRNEGTWFGGVLGYGGKTTIIDSTVSDNTGNYYGGGVLNLGNEMIIINSTISGNRALNFRPGRTNGGEGGGIYIQDGGSLHLINSTVTDNYALESGGGIFNSVGMLTMDRSIVSGNRTGGDGAEISVRNRFYSAVTNADNFNIFGDDSKTAAEAFFGFTPGGSDTDATSDSLTPWLLASIIEPSLTGNGGPTTTHVLPAGSPALDLAPNADCELPSLTAGRDQRGHPRNLDGDGQASANECDAGAFERDPANTDGDGVPSAVEQGAPNGGDGNNDGIPDDTQTHVASLPNGGAGGYITLESPAGTALENVQADPAPDPQDAPPGLTFPVGVLSFDVRPIEPGGTVVVTLYLNAAPQIDSYWKFGPTADNPTDHWYHFDYDGQTGAQILSDRVVLNFIDGGRGDADMAANGRLTDPGGPTTPVTAALFFSATTPGKTVDGLDFGSEDIIKWDGAVWSMFFDGSAAGLTPTGKWKHNINAFYIDGSEIIMSFTQNARFVPGIVPKVDGMDLVKWDGSAFSLWFDGSDVGLDNKTQEKIDGLHILPGSESPVGDGCLAYVLTSTQGPGKVKNPGEPSIKFGGEDVLGFCATNLGADTAGLWHMVMDGSAEGMPRNSTDSISFSDDGQTMYLTTQGAFAVDAAAGGHSMVYKFDFGTGAFSGPVFSAPAEGLPKKVDGLQIK